MRPPTSILQRWHHGRKHGTTFISIISLHFYWRFCVSGLRPVSARRTTVTVFEAAWWGCLCLRFYGLLVLRLVKTGSLVIFGLAAVTAVLSVQTLYQSAVLFMYWQTGRFAFVLLDDNVRPEKRAGRPLGREGDIHDEYNPSCLEIEASRLRACLAKRLAPSLMLAGKTTGGGRSATSTCNVSSSAP